MSAVLTAENIRNSVFENVFYKTTTESHMVQQFPFVQLLICNVFIWIHVFFAALLLIEK